jgi:hypothetical protein
VRETPPAPTSDSAVKTPVVTEVKPEPLSQPVKPEPLTDRQIQAEREQQAMREIQELRAKREAQLKEAQANPDSKLNPESKPETQTVQQEEKPASIPNAPSAKILAEADAYVRGGKYASQNFGKEAILGTKTGQDPTHTRKIYVRFDLTNQPISIKSAKLRVCAVNVKSSTRSVNLVTDDTWQETGITWDNAPAPTEPALGTWQPVTNQFAEVDITSAVQKELAGDKKISLLIYATSLEGRQNIADFASREAANGPELVIEYSTPAK